MKRILVACEFSGIVRDAFAAKGWDAWSCDLLPTERPNGNHICGDVTVVLGEGWDMMIAHPPCTYLCRSGWNWVNKPDQDKVPLKGEPRRIAAMDAAGFFRTLLNAPIARIAVENPRPICHVNLPKPTQTIHPWQYGHGETKATCLWLKNLPRLMPTHRRGDLFCAEEPIEREQRIHNMSPSPNRSKERSRTYEGIAKAMADQWGSL